MLHRFQTPHFLRRIVPTCRPGAWAPGCRILSGNSFPWTLPLALLKKSALGTLGLADCGIHGPLPPLAAFPPVSGTHLGQLNLSHNSLTGSLPSAWAALPEFLVADSLDLSYNHLTGAIPWEWVDSTWSPVM